MKIPYPLLPANSNVLSLVPPVRIGGWGFWMGRGVTRALRTFQNRPS